MKIREIRGINLSNGSNMDDMHMNSEYKIEIKTIFIAVQKLPKKYLGNFYQKIITKLLEQNSTNLPSCILRMLYI